MASQHITRATHLARFHTSSPVLAGLLAAACLLGTQLAEAKTFTVTFGLDSSSDGVCGSDGDCTLRDAIQAANGNPGPDTIKFSSFVSGARMNLFPGDEMPINDAVKILGPGSNRFVIDAEGDSRIFDVTPSLVGTDVVISGLSLRGGSEVNGGAILHEGADLILRDVVISDSVATGLGGGIHSSGGTLVIEDSVIGAADFFDDPQAAGFSRPGNAAPSGGGIYFTASNPAALLGLSITRSTIRGNEATAGNGGGLLLDQIDNTVLITNSSISDNECSNVGGGLYVVDSGNEGHVTLRNTSIFSNLSGVNGAGMAVSNLGALVLLENLTLSDNDAVSNGGGLFATSTFGLLQLRGLTVSDNEAGTGGGIFSNDAEPLLLVNSIVGGNSFTTVDPDISAINFFTQASVIQDIGTPSSSGGYYIKLPPDLNALADYGGPTPTHSLTKGSPAVDAGDVQTCALLNSNKDQRGQLRTVDANNDGNLTCDIGAVEFNGRSIACDPTPVGACTTFPNGNILLTNNAGNKTDALRVAMTSGSTPTTSFFGDPSYHNGTANAVCIYANEVPMTAPDRLIGSLNLPAGERNSMGVSLWKLLTGGRTSYALSARNIDGVSSMRQTPSKTAVSMEGVVTVAASGLKLTVPDVPLMPPASLTVLVQNVTSDGACAEVSFTGTEIKTFTFTRFSATK